MKDLLLNSDGDIAIADDDLVIGICDQQMQQRLLLTEKGDIKQFPMAGVGTINFLEGEDEGALLREVSIQFTADGMTVKEVKLVNKVLLTNASYEDS